MFADVVPWSGLTSLAQYSVPWPYSLSMQRDQAQHCATATLSRACIIHNKPLTPNTKRNVVRLKAPELGR
jgi:hypothetical protein